LSKWTKYVRKIRKIKKYVRTCIYDEICKIKYSSYNRKSFETNLSLAETNSSCHRKNMYLHINPSPRYDELSMNIMALPPSTKPLDEPI